MSRIHMPSVPVVLMTSGMSSPICGDQALPRGCLVGRAVENDVAGRTQMFERFHAGVGGFRAAVGRPSRASAS